MIPKAGWSLPIPGLNLSLTEKRKLLLCLVNALELLDQPGEWYQDYPSGRIYYYPRPHEDMTKAQVIIPALETLLTVNGTLERPVRNIHFKYIFRTYFMDAPLLSRTRYIARRFPSAGCLQTTHTGAA